MSLVLNEDQVMLRESARAFCREQAPIHVLRRVRDQEVTEGYPRELWQAMVELGWAGMAIPESYGGFEFGYSGLGLVLEEMGRTLVPSPMVSTVLLSASLINLAGNETQKSEWLSAVVSGAVVMALALEEGSFHNPAKIECNVRRSADGFVLNGEKRLVLDGQTADHLVVVARSSGQPTDSEGISLLVVDAQLPG